MAKRRQKKRTHVKPNEEELKTIPRSMVLRLGSNMKNHSLTQLVSDVRSFMQPHTAIKLRERKSNKLKDFIVMAGPLNVTHLLIFSQSEAGTTRLRLGRMPRGPTLTFKVNNYSLCQDVKRIQKHPKSISKDSKEYLNPPLLVLNGFQNPSTADPQEKLLITTFQNMFPPIQPQNTKVSSVRRVLMLYKDRETGHIDLRHYAIDTKSVEGSKAVQRLINAKTNLRKSLPNFHNAADISDLVLDPYANGGFTSDSEVEEDNVIDVKEDDVAVVNKKTASAPSDSESQASKPNVRKKAIKLTEIGPRLSLTLTKIEEGISTGKVLYHHEIKKTKREIDQLEQKHVKRQKIKEERKKIQAENVAQKKAKKEAKKERRRQQREKGETVESESSSEGGDSDDEISEDIDSDLWSENEDKDVSSS